MTKDTYQSSGVAEPLRSAIAACLNDAINSAVANGANSVSMPDYMVEVAAWLAGLSAHHTANDEHDGFEAVFKAWPYEWPDARFKRDGTGYFDVDTHFCWCAWQARAALATQPAAPAEVGAAGRALQTGIANDKITVRVLAGSSIKFGDLLHIAPVGAKAPAAPSVGEPVTRDTLRIGGRYNWKGQPERLVYMGLCEPRNGRWHQFAKVDAPTVCWSEVTDDDLRSFEATPPAAPAAPAATEAPSDVIAWSTGIVWKNRQSEMVVKLTRKAQPEHGFIHALHAATTTAVSASVQPVPESLSDERLTVAAISMATKTKMQPLMRAIKDAGEGEVTANQKLTMDQALRALTALATTSSAASEVKP